MLMLDQCIYTVFTEQTLDKSNINACVMWTSVSTFTLHVLYLRERERERQRRSMMELYTVYIPIGVAHMAALVYPSMG